MLFQIALFAFLISFFYAVIIYIFDKYEKEPIWLLAKSYIIGMLAVPAVVILTRIAPSLSELASHTSLQRLLNCYIEAGLYEETMKFTFIYLLIWNKKEFNETMDGIVYFAMCGLGFAVIENIQYIAAMSTNKLLFIKNLQYNLELLNIIVFRSLPGHVLINAIGGYFVGRAKFGEESPALWLAIGYIISVIFHGTFNLLAPSFPYLILYILALCVLLAGLIHKARKATPFRKERLREEIDSEIWEAIREAQENATANKGIILILIPVLISMSIFIYVFTAWLTQLVR